MADRSASLPRRFVWSRCSVAVTMCGLLASAGLVLGSERRETATVRVYRSVQRAVVNISGEKTVPVAAAQTSAVHSDVNRHVNGMGTGVVINGRGYVLTNYHVVNGVPEHGIQVTLVNTTRRTAKLIARDPETDLAIIKVELAAGSGCRRSASARLRT